MNTPKFKFNELSTPNWVSGEQRIAWSTKNPIPECIDLVVIKLEFPEIFGTRIYIEYSFCETIIRNWFLDLRDASV